MKTEKEKQTNKALKALSALPCFQSPRKGLRPGPQHADRGGSAGCAIPSRFPRGSAEPAGEARCTSRGAPESPCPSAQQQPRPHGSAAPGQPAPAGRGSRCEPRSRPAPRLPRTRRRPRSRPRDAGRAGSPRGTLASSRCPATQQCRNTARGPAQPRAPRGLRCPPAAQVAPRRPRAPRTCSPPPRWVGSWRRSGRKCCARRGRPAAGCPRRTSPGPDRTGPDRTGREAPPAAARHRVPAAGGRRRARPSAPGRSRRSAPPSLPCCRRGGPGEPRWRRGVAVAVAPEMGEPRRAGGPGPCCAERPGPPMGKARRPRAGMVARCVWVCCFFLFFFFF